MPYECLEHRVAHQHEDLELFVLFNPLMSHSCEVKQKLLPWHGKLGQTCFWLLETGDPKNQGQRRKKIGEHIHSSSRNSQKEVGRLWEKGVLVQMKRIDRWGLSFYC